jgi:hypothetical protein
MSAASVFRVLYAIPCGPAAVCPCCEDNRSRHPGRLKPPSRSRRNTRPSLPRRRRHRPRRRWPPPDNRPPSGAASPGQRGESRPHDVGPTTTDSVR